MLHIQGFFTKSSVHIYLAMLDTYPLVPLGSKTWFQNLELFNEIFWNILLLLVNSLEVSYDSLLDRLWRSWKTVQVGFVVVGVLKSLQCYQLEMVGPLSLFPCRLAFVSDHSICWRITGSYMLFLVVPSDVCSYYFSSCKRFLDTEIHNHPGGWQSCGVYRYEPFFLCLTC